MEENACISCEYAKDTRDENGKYIIFCRLHKEKRKIEDDELYTVPNWCPCIEDVV